MEHNMTQEQIRQALEPKFEAIMARFDFEKVAYLMGVVNWKYATLAEEGKVPNADELRSHAFNLFYGVSLEDKSKSTRWGSGGLYWKLFYWEGVPHLELAFQYEFVTSF
jgi:hypothetical protein